MGSLASFIIRNMEVSMVTSELNDSNLVPRAFPRLYGKAPWGRGWLHSATNESISMYSCSWRHFSQALQCRLEEALGIFVGKKYCLHMHEPIRTLQVVTSRCHDRTNCPFSLPLSSSLLKILLPWLRDVTPLLSIING